MAAELCPSIYLVFYFKWRGVGLVIAWWIWVVTDKSRIIELIAVLCFLMPPPPSFPTWLRQRGVCIGSPFSPRFPRLHQCPCLCVTFSLRPIVPPNLHVPVSFSISLYPIWGKLTNKCEFQSLQEFLQFWLHSTTECNIVWFWEKRDSFLSTGFCPGLPQWRCRHARGDFVVPAAKTGQRQNKQGW